MSEGTSVNGGSKHVPSTRALDWPWVDRTVWTDRMLTALETVSEEAGVAFFAARGLFTLTEARAAACRSR